MKVYNPKDWLKLTPYFYKFDYPKKTALLLVPTALLSQGVPFVFYALISMEIIAKSIEAPFDRDSDRLPIDKITS